MGVSLRAEHTSAATAPPTSPFRRRLGIATFAWVVLFAAFHVYWAFGGQFGFGDASVTTPEADSPTDWAFTAVLGVMFVVGAVVPLAFSMPRGAKFPRWALATCSWIGGVPLTLRGLSGLLDTLLHGTGLAHNGLTGMTYQEILGDAHPSAYTLWSTSSIDMYFFLGGILFCVIAVAHRRARR
jgi:hypothetical protein